MSELKVFVYECPNCKMWGSITRVQAGQYYCTHCKMASSLHTCKTRIMDVTKEVENAQSRETPADAEHHDEEDA